MGSKFIKNFMNPSKFSPKPMKNHNMDIEIASYLNLPIKYHLSLHTLNSFNAKNGMKLFL